PGKITSQYPAMRGSAASNFARASTSAVALRFRKALDESGQTEPVVAMAVGDVNARQPPLLGIDPVGQSVHLVMGGQRVDEDRVMLAVDQRGRGLAIRSACHPGLRA